MSEELIKVIKATVYDMSTYTHAGSSPEKTYIGYWNLDDSQSIINYIKDLYGVIIPDNFEIPYSNDFGRYFVEIQMKSFTQGDNILL